MEQLPLALSPVVHYFGGIPPASPCGADWPQDRVVAFIPDAWSKVTCPACLAKREAA